MTAPPDSHAEATINVHGNGSTKLAAEVAKGMRRQGLATLALWLTFVVVVFAALYVRSSDLEAQTDRVEVVAAQNREALQRSDRALLHLCETNDHLELAIKQFIAADVVRFRTASATERRLISRNLDALVSLNVFLADKRDCGEVTG